MEAMWVALGIPIGGCADIRMDDGEMLISKTDETGGEKKFEIIRANEGYDVYQTITFNGRMCQCRMFSHHITDEAYDVAIGIYSGILWGDVFSQGVICFYSANDEQICKFVRQP